MKALKLVVHMEDGKTHEFIFSEPKPSSVSKKLNQNASGKIAAVGEGGLVVRFQLGCNLTRLKD
jgi:hypothetical protein